MPRTPEQNRNIREKRKRKLIAHALKAFAQYGYDELTIDDITKVAKCSHGLFYHYYDAKEQIYEDVMRIYVFPLAMDKRIQEAKEVGGLKGIYILAKWATELIMARDNSTYAMILLTSTHLATTYVKSPNFKAPDMDFKTFFHLLASQAIERGEVKDCTEDDLCLLVHDIIIGAKTRFLLDKKDTRIVNPDFLLNLIQK